jgi:hypothetical protein
MGGRSMLILFVSVKTARVALLYETALLGANIRVNNVGLD